MINQQKQETPNTKESNYLSTLGANKKIITKIFNLNQLKNQYKEGKQEYKLNDQSGNLFIGGSKILTEDILSKHKIKALLTVLDYKTYQKMNLQEKILDLDSVQKHFFVDISNDQSEDITVYAKNSYDFIDENLPYMNVLVHCSDGLCRSPTIVISYLMKRFNLNYDEAYKLIQNENKLIKIKPGFQAQLKKSTDTSTQTTATKDISTNEEQMQIVQKQKQKQSTLENITKNSQQKQIQE